MEAKIMPNLHSATSAIQAHTFLDRSLFPSTPSEMANPPGESSSGT